MQAIESADNPMPSSSDYTKFGWLSFQQPPGSMTIYDQIVAFVTDSDVSRFEALALEVFRHQFANVAPYRDYCRALGVHDDDVTRLDDIPAVSTLAFKYTRLSGTDGSACEKIFLTSGTTIGRSERGTHIVSHPDIYRASALAHLQKMMFPDRPKMRILAMHPTADRMPESSLSQMISWCIEEFGAGRCECIADRRRIDTDAACEFLIDAERAGESVCILGTTASLGALFAHLESCAVRIALAAGSRIMDTGGAKGQASPLDSEAVCARARELLGLAAMMVINEYGMTELCSQLYDATPFNSDDDSTPSRRVKIAPPWMRAAAVDPVSLRPVAPGEIGMLRFFDLANVCSVSAILTEDFGVVNDAGDRVRIIGRAGVSEPRGCALAIEQFEAAEIQRLQ
jgi:hypothetical protein